MELILRAQHNDQDAIGDLLGNPAAISPRHRPLIRRLIVDGTAAATSDQFSSAAADSAVQLLVDPLTHHLTTEQDPSDSWANLPFASSAALDTDALQDRNVRHNLIRNVVDFQFSMNATAIIPPYIHLHRPDGAEARIQRALITETAAHLQSLRLVVDLFPVVSVDQSQVRLEPAHWSAGLGRLVTTASSVADGPFGLALSMSGALNATNLLRAARIWDLVGRSGRAIAWHGGKTGLMAVAMGADGYEVGLASGETWDAASSQRNRRVRREDEKRRGGAYVGVYVDVLHQSISKSAVEKLARHRALEADLNCFDPDCCPDGLKSMIESQRRQHAARCRLADLDTLIAVRSRPWRLHHLERKASEAEAAADRIRQAATSSSIAVGAYPKVFADMRSVLSSLREAARSDTA